VIERPGHPLSTKNAAIPAGAPSTSVCAYKRNRPADAALVIHALEPFNRQPPRMRVALVCIAAASAPADGSVIPTERISTPVCIRPTYRSIWEGEPYSAIEPPVHSKAKSKRKIRRGQDAEDLSHAEIVQSQTAVLGTDPERSNSDIDCFSELSRCHRARLFPSGSPRQNRIASEILGDGNDAHCSPRLGRRIVFGRKLSIGCKRLCAKTRARISRRSRKFS